MHQDNSLFSIVTPTLNSENYIEETIQSIFNQTYKNIEYIIVDGGSSDATLDKFIRKYKDKISQSFLNRTKECMMQSIKASMYAKGKFFTYLNSDDCCIIILLKKLSITLKKIIT